MGSIEAKVFNTPTVYKEKEKVLFPFRKAEALFYYLLVKGEATRDELVSLLWGEIDEETAKKNLRNAMYKIRKVFGLEIIISPRKSIVMLNPDIQIDTDLQVFLSDNPEDVNVYNGEFLQGFLVKEGERFEEWMFSTREKYKDMYITRINQRIEAEIEENHWDSIEHYCKLLINVDQFDERPYRTLMKLYKKEGTYNKGIDLFQKLTKTLDKELGIKPDAETRKIYTQVLKLRDLQEGQIKKPNEDFFYGRKKELNILKQNAQLFMQEGVGKPLLIIGEAGIGKSRLKEAFLQMIEEKDIYIFHSNCYQAEENYILKPWNPIFSKITDIIKKDNIKIPAVWRNIISYFFPIFATEGSLPNLQSVERMDALQYQVAEEAMQGVFKCLSEKKKILLVFDDLQWMDSMSLSLLSSILLHDHHKRVMFVGTCRNGYDEKIDKLIGLLTKYNCLDKIVVERFNEVEVKEFIEEALPNISVTEEIKKKIFQETEGNTFFLVEFLNSIKENRNIGEMSTKMKDILKSRIIDISEEGRKVLNIIALFFDKATLDILKILLGKDELEVMEMIEELQNKWLIKENHEEGKISFQFTHQKIREFIYIQQSVAKKKLLHNKIGYIIEKQLTNDKRDILIYSRLIYHFSNGGNSLASLKYQIKNVNAYLDFTHELFPILSSTDPIKENSLYLSKHECNKYLEEIDITLEQIKRQESLSKEIIELQITFYHMKGRYLIGEGKYEEGIGYIQEMINDALGIGNYNYILKGYRQMIYYAIQTHNTPLMEDYLHKGLKQVYENKIKNEEAIFLRLKGLSKIMSCKYDEAEEILKQAIGLFNDISKMEDNFALNIAASYSYLGEIRRYKMQFNPALNYYDKAMAICEEKNVTRGLTIFNTNAGQAAFDMGDYERAKVYFEKALKIYRQFDILWGRSIAEGYMTILLTRRGCYKDALESLKRAEQYSYQLKSPYEIGLVYRVKAEIKSNMKNNKKLQIVFDKYLIEDLEVYCTRGIEYLRQVKDSYEIEILSVLKKGSE